MYKPIIGMEIHVELRTKSKMFCGCPADHFGKPQNTQTCPVCLGLPGALPVPNEKAIRWTQSLGAALNCHLNPISKFDRKHYFYPDLAKGYQISQYDEPLCSGGLVSTELGPIAVTRVHLEEDTGKLQHQIINGISKSLVDFNRSGVALVEIVSEPVIHSAKAAKAYAHKVQQIIRYLGISDADMEKGSLRLEANISLQSESKKTLPSYKVEVKNLNSFRFLEKAIDYEIERQQKILNSGKVPIQETRGFSEIKGETFSQRSKEEAQDYRYFPEPDIPAMEFSRAELKKIKSQLPLLPDDYLKLFTQTYACRLDYALTLIKDPKLASQALTCFIEGLKTNISANQIASFIINKKLISPKLDPHKILSQLQAPQSSDLDESIINSTVDTVLKVNPSIVLKYQNGKTSVIGFLIGQTMKALHGKGDPQIVGKLIDKRLKQINQ